MKFVDQRTAAAFCAAVFGLGLGPSVVLAQTAKKPATSSAQGAPSSPGQKCANPGVDAEQIRAMLRNMQIEEKLSGLSQRLAQEEAMSSPEIAKLQNLSARLGGKEGELEARAEAMSARAQEIASEVKNGLQENGNVFISGDDDSGWLGVEIEEVTTQKAKDLKLPSVRGVLVEEVEPDSPAGKAGLKQNDVILQYDGQAVEGTVQFRRLVRETPAGRTVTLEISRNGATQNVSVDLGDRSAFFEKKMKGKMRDFDNALAFSMPNPDFSFSIPSMDGRGPMLGISAEDVS